MARSKGDAGARAAVPVALLWPPDVEPGNVASRCPTRWGFGAHLWRQVARPVSAGRPARRGVGQDARALRPSDAFRREVRGWQDVVEKKSVFVVR